LNAERLHAIALALKRDLESTNSVELVTQLATALSQQVSDPAQPAYQQQVSSTREQLEGALAAAPTNNFSPAWRRVLEELNLDDLFGSLLLERIRDVFERNQLTPATASQRLQELAGRLGELSSALDSLLAGLEWFSIGAETLEPGAFEVGVLIPRAEVDNELRPLGDEFVELSRILSPFVELATGSRPGLDVRSISSSEFQVFIDAIGPAAACIAVAVERVVALYKQLLEIRLLHQQLKDAGVAEQRLEGVNEHANEHMQKGIEPLVEELVNQFGGASDPGRTNELRIEIRHSLNAIANRIDRSYNVEVRAGPPPEPGELEGDGETTPPSDDSSWEAVTATQEGLQFINRTGDRILSLSEAENAGEAAAD
jgi:hypothetical protein